MSNEMHALLTYKKYLCSFSLLSFHSCFGTQVQAPFCTGGHIFEASINPELLPQMLYSSTKAVLQGCSIQGNQRCKRPFNQIMITKK